MSPSSRFHYPLQPLLTRQAWELDQVSAELGVARQALDRSEQSVAARQAQLTELWQAFGRLRDADAPLDLTREATMRGYAQHLLDALAQDEARQREAQGLHDRLCAAARHALQQVRTLEKQRGHQQSQHEAEWRRRDGRDADDRWLATRQRAGGATP